MMEFILNSRTHGPQHFTAINTDGFAYVRLDGRQICHGGRFHGNTVTCRGNDEALEEASRKWWKAYLRRERELGQYWMDVEKGSAR